jgi:hypothetical protein
VNRTLVFASVVLVVACQDGSEGDATGSGGGTPLLPNVTAVGPGPGAGPGGSGGAPTGPGAGPGGDGGTGDGGAGVGASGGGGNASGGAGGAGGSGGCGPAPGGGEIVFNELHTSPDQNTDDVNCDGNTSTGDEFIEIVNAAGASRELTGVELRENGTLRYTFAGCLEAGQAIVVYKSSVTSMCGAGDWGSTTGVSADSNFTLTNGGGETLTLELGATTLDSVTTLNLGSTSPRTSMTRNPDVTGTFEEHTSADTVDSSPFSVGTCIDGSFFPCN